MVRLPVLFLAHGAPPMLDDRAWTDELAGWARTFPSPRAILVLSAHWESSPLALGATRTLPLLYDFYGFPRKYYRLQYPAPGAPALAARVRTLLDTARIAHVDQPDRGLDHGVYLPLTCMYPRADVPVLQVSLSSNDPHEQYRLGRALSPLREEGVLLVGSGFLSHNLRVLVEPEVPAWGVEFDAWVADTVGRRDDDALLDYATRAPAVDLALPTPEHFVPLLFAAGAAPDDATTFPITGFRWNLTRRSVQFG